MRSNLCAFFVLSLVLTMAKPGSWAEPLNQGRLPSQQQTPPKDEERVRIERDMAKKANEQRQADLKRDTEKLLQLATELQQYVNKSNEHLLSLEVIKKAEEIEKLAHSVKAKMKGN